MPGILESAFYSPLNFRLKLRPSLYDMALSNVRIDGGVTSAKSSIQKSGCLFVSPYKAGGGRLTKEIFTLHLL